ncbi:response regulator transcription factor [Chromatiaceae bacterium AAb-1]|nr:response regulator transcription factor [Chromatiaceae bacterium AAb-1]
MNRSHLIFTAQHFVSPRWQSAMPDAEQRTSPDTGTGEQYQLVWVLTGIPDWQSVIRHYRQQGKPVIAMTRHGNIGELRQALSAGATGYIDALASTALLQQAGSSVMSGALWLPASLINGIISVLSDALPSAQATPDILAILTRREQEVTRIVLTGSSNKQVARQLNITERTVKEHLSSVFTKLNVSDRLQLMLKVRG